MLNIENIDKVIAAIKAEPELLKMYGWNGQKVDAPNICGTAACIGGWAEIIAKKEGFVVEYNSNILGPSQWLGLNRELENDLFLMNGDIQRKMFDKKPAPMRAKVAIEVLENLKATGVVDWNSALIRNGLDDVAEQRDNFF